MLGGLLEEGVFYVEYCGALVRTLSQLPATLNHMLQNSDRYHQVTDVTTEWSDMIISQSSHISSVILCITTHSEY